MIGISILIILLILLVFSNLGSSDGTVDYTAGSGGKGIAHSGSWRKPKGLNVVALVFFGRRANVQILERYLRVIPPQNAGKRTPLVYGYAVGVVEERVPETELTVEKPGG